jgi:hypothetical protein
LANGDAQIYCNAPAPQSVALPVKFSRTRIIGRDSVEPLNFHC